MSARTKKTNGKRPKKPRLTIKFSRDKPRKKPDKIDTSHRVEFVNPKEAADYQCGVCLNTIRDATALCQHHIFCYNCIQLLIQHSPNVINHVSCPTCRKQVNIVNIKRVKFIDRQIGNLQTKCPNHQITTQKALYAQYLPDTQQSPPNNDYNRTPDDGNHNKKRNTVNKRRDSRNSRSRSRSRSRERY